MKLVFVITFWHVYFILYVKNFPLNNNHIVCLYQYTHLTYLKIDILIKCFPKKLTQDNLDSGHSQDDQDSDIPGSLDHACAVAYCSNIGVRIIRAVSSCRNQTTRRWYELIL